MGSLTFEIKELPKMPNQLLRQKWQVVAGEKRKWNRMIAKEVEWSMEPLKSAELTLTRYSTRQPDFDGLTGSFKICIDSLVKIGVLIDDNPTIIGYPTYRWEKCALKDQKVMITVAW